MGGYAWVTLATNDAYSLGALVLAHSLRRVGTKYELAVLVTPGVTEIMRNNLAAVFSVVQEVNVLDSKDQANLALLARPELGITFTKLHCWRLTQYDKCVFMDADTLVIRNCDELFEREEFSAAPDVGWPDCFNSGVFVYVPSQQTFASITAFAAAKGSFDGGDQGLLNMYFSDWAHKDISKHLPFIYNMCATATYSYLPAFKQYGENVRIIHFIGATKPWLQYFDTMTGFVQPPQNCNHLQPLFQLWWNIFCEKVHPQLSPVMATSTLAPIWHEYTPMHFRSPIPESPTVHTDLRSDLYDGTYARSPDFSEFKDPWDDYCIPNEPPVHSNPQPQTYHCDTISNVCHNHYESVSEHRPEHHNERYIVKETESTHDNERLNETNKQYHRSTQTDVEERDSLANVESRNELAPSNETQYFHLPERNTGVAHAHEHEDTSQSPYSNERNSYDERTLESAKAQTAPHYDLEPSGVPSHSHENRISFPESFNDVKEHTSNEIHSTCRGSTHEEDIESEVRNGQLSINRNAESSENNLAVVEERTDIQSMITSLPNSTPCTESRTVGTQSDVNVTERLEGANAGLAGALAQITLGERRSAEQIALEEHMRKQSWEHGQIDYMGRDSFDNIWKKICETLSLASPRSSPPKDVSTSAEKSAEDTEKKETAEKPDEATNHHLTQPESAVSFTADRTLAAQSDGTAARESDAQTLTNAPEECRKAEEYPHRKALGKPLSRKEVQVPSQQTQQELSTRSEETSTDIILISDVEEDNLLQTFCSKCGNAVMLRTLSVSRASSKTSLDESPRNSTSLAKNIPSELDSADEIVVLSDSEISGEFPKSERTCDYSDIDEILVKSLVSEAEVELVSRQCEEILEEKRVNISSGINATLVATSKTEDYSNTSNLSCGIAIEIGSGTKETERLTEELNEVLEETLQSKVLDDNTIELAPKHFDSHNLGSTNQLSEIEIVNLTPLTTVSITKSEVEPIFRSTTEATSSVIERTVKEIVAELAANIIEGVAVEKESAELDRVIGFS